jgi:preprotein translocase subunit Sss1
LQADTGLSEKRAATVFIVEGGVGMLVQTIGNLLQGYTV